ncbi:unnamed protein product, partial [Ixodes hexagonus]
FYFRGLALASLCVVTAPSSVLWNVEIPRPPPKSLFGFDSGSGFRSEHCDKVASRNQIFAKLTANISLLISATQQGVRESSKFLQKYGFQDSKYENVTWPRLRRRPNARVFETVAYASQFATEYIARRLKLKPGEIGTGVSCVDIKDTALGRICPPDLARSYHVCPRRALQLRSADGRCNNFEKPSSGAAFSSFVRLLPARYADGISRVRTSTAGSPLPSPRLISQSLTLDLNHPHPRATLMLMQWGQFLDHDLSLATLSVSRSGFPPKCCRPLMSFEDVHPACLAIGVSWRDKFYKKFDTTCMEFSRSAPAAKPGCRLGPRDHINQITSFIDASTVYGSTPEETQMLRSFQKGLLRNSEVKGLMPLLPPGTDAEILECQERGRNSKCFLAGNYQTHKYFSHLIRIGRRPPWLKCRFKGHCHTITRSHHCHVGMQETRRIVGAEIQHISFSEFLPTVLGESMVQIFGLKLVSSGYYRGYDPVESSDISNVFAAAAFRFGHSMVPRSFHRYDKNHRLLLNGKAMVPSFFNPTELFKPGGIDRLILGLVNQAAQSVDEHMTSEVTNRLFQPQGRDFGLDLMALNVQRARDHGIAEYLVWRRYCGLQEVRSFEELAHFTGPGTAAMLKQIYLSIEDVDLFPAALAEKPVLGGMIGPTFACLIAEQFVRLRNGDRFWYENGGLASSFRPGNSLHFKVSLLRCLSCR